MEYRIETWLLEKVQKLVIGLMLLNDALGAGSTLRTGVILADAMVLQQYGLSMEELSRSLTQHPSVQHMIIQEGPLSSSKSISQLVQSHRIAALVVGVAFDNDPGAIHAMAARSGLNPLSLAVVELVPFLALWHQNRKEFTARVAKLLTLHAAMVSASSLAGRAGRTLVKPGKKMSRRVFLGSVTSGLVEPSQKPIVLTELCGRYVSHCSYCIRECKFDAITRGRESVEVNDSKCVKCGACASVCPVGALQPPTASDSQILRLFDVSTFDSFRPTRLLLTCSIGTARLKDEIQRGERISHDTSIIELPCIAVCGWSHLVDAVAADANLTLLCASDTCPKRPAVATAGKAVRSVNALSKSAYAPFAPIVYLEARDDSCLSALIEESHHESIPAYSGRNEFREVGERRGVLTRDLETVQRRLPSEFRLANDEASMIFDLDVDHRCTLCGACPANCPENALTLEKHGNVETLSFLPTRCVGCEICVGICPENAIQLRRVFGKIYWTQGTKIEKFSDEVLLCSSCGKPVAPVKSILKIERILGDRKRSIAALIRYCDDCKLSRLAARSAS